MRTKLQVFLVCVAVLALVGTALFLIFKQDSDSPIEPVDSANAGVVYCKNRDYVFAFQKNITPDEQGRMVIFVDVINIRKTTAEFIHVMRALEMFLRERNAFGPPGTWEIQSWVSHGSTSQSVRYAITAIPKKK